MANRSRAGRLSPAQRAAEARRLRDEHNLTQREIAERLDVSPSTIGKDLRGPSDTSAASPSDEDSPPRARADAPTATEPAGILGAVRLLIGALRSIIGAGRRLLP